MESEANHSGERPFVLKYFPTLHDSDAYFESVLDPTNVRRRLLNQFLLVLLFSFVYGAAMGAYHSMLQAMAAGVKVAVIFVLVLVICFPAFYIVQYIMGSRLRLHQMMSIVLSGFILMTAMMVAFLPIVIIFLLTGGNYYFLHLLHIAIFILCGVFGMNAVVRALQYSCEKKDIYPHTGVVVFRFWVVILAFVGIQLAWHFRPFLGDRNRPFELFRDYEGNFYAALIYSVNKLIEPEPEAESIRSSEFAPKTNLNYDTLLLHEMTGDTSGGN